MAAPKASVSYFSLRGTNDSSKQLGKGNRNFNLNSVHSSTNILGLPGPAGAYSLGERTYQLCCVSFQSILFCFPEQTKTDPRLDSRAQKRKDDVSGSPDDLLLL